MYNKREKGKGRSKWTIDLTERISSPIPKAAGEEAMIQMNRQNIPQGGSVRPCAAQGGRMRKGMSRKKRDFSGKPEWHSLAARQNDRSNICLMNGKRRLFRSMAPQRRSGRRKAMPQATAIPKIAAIPIEAAKIPPGKGIKRNAKSAG